MHSAQSAESRKSCGKEYWRARAWSHRPCDAVLHEYNMFAGPCDWQGSAQRWTLDNLQIYKVRCVAGMPSKRPKTLPATSPTATPTSAAAPVGTAAPERRGWFGRDKRDGADMGPAAAGVGAGTAAGAHPTHLLV